MKFLNNKIFEIVSQEAQILGVEAFVIGGFVRDSLLERKSTDIDIVCEGSGIELAQAVGERVGSRVTIFKNFGTAMLRWGKWEVEFVGARKESYRASSRKPIVESGTLEDDQLRRDFTINSLAYSLNYNSYGNLIDPFGGVDHLKERVIKTPLEPKKTYSDDPLRMLRAIRFATQLNFTIESQSFNAIVEMRDRLSIVSKERINEEFFKILLAPKPSIGIKLLDKSKLLEQVLPQLIELKGVERRGRVSHKDNFIHTLEVLDNVAKVSDNLWLRWSALLHDIAKPNVKRFEEGVGWTFHGHEYLGMKMVASIFKEMKLPQNEKMRYVQKLVQLHLRPIALAQEEVTDSAVRRLLFDAGDEIEDLMLLCEADITSKNHETKRKFLSNFALVRRKLIEVEEKDAIRNFKNPITGDYLMERYTLAPGREIGVIKEYVKNAILEGKIGNNFHEAEELTKELAKEMGLKEKTTCKERAINGERAQLDA
ncbi:MAG: HD domain-containing protein [Bacteroidales bacterium]